MALPEYQYTIRRDIDCYTAMGRGLRLASEMGFTQADRTRIQIAILELARNLVAHAGGGMIRIVCLEDPERGRGILIESHDTGPGIADIGLALQDGYSTAATMGAGLPGVQRLMDSLEIESQLGVGSLIRAIRWLPKARKER